MAAATSAKLPLPTPDAFGRLLTGLFDKRVQVTKIAPLAPAAYRAVGAYMDASKNVLYACACDLPLFAALGAALAMVPPAVVTEAVRSGKPSDVLRENAYEVFNIGASVFNEIDGTTVHVKLRDVVLAPPLPPALLPKITKPVSRVDLEITVPGYPAGKLSILAFA